MKHKFSYRIFSLAALLVTTAAARGESFTIQVGDVISQNVPGAGAGYIETSTANDFYTFTAAAGQLVFVEELSVASAFAGWLQWSITSPANVVVFSGYFTGTAKGRLVLPASGTYTIKVWVGSNNASYVGAYAFRLRPIPADQVFTIPIGSTVSNGIPAVGAGNIEVPGASDVFNFTATNGQSAFFEELYATNAFAGWLQWIVKSPANSTVFSSYFDNNGPGRITFTESGTYSLRVIAGAHSTNYFGTYAFRIRSIPPDDVFAIPVGDTVTNGVPGAGAGNIEVAGAYDRYTFTGAAGQEIYFDNIAAAPSLGGWLKWEVLTPGGQTVFSTFFTGGSVGKKTLPDAGVYSLRVWVASNDPSLTGAYAFRLRAVESSQFAINIGAQVSDAVPVTGAGRIETAGGQDTYTFTGTVGQKVNFQQINAAAAFAGWLNWEVKTPAGSNWFTHFFQNGHTETRVLPQTGTYTVRVLAAANNPAYVGTYSFKTWSDVSAGPDKVAMLPGAALVIPKSSLLCNDSGEAADVLSIELPANTSARGGVVTQNVSFVSYTPLAGFSGVDTFQYRLRGNFGGESLTTVTVNVLPGADRGASVVSHSRAGQNLVSVCLLGLPSQSYQVEESTNLAQWVFKQNITADVNGVMNYTYATTNGPARYYRFRRP